MFYGRIKITMVNFFRNIQAQLASQRYRWIREGVKAGKLFVGSGVVPDFKHEHAGCDCKPDSVFWKETAFDRYVELHSGG